MRRFRARLASRISWSSPSTLGSSFFPFFTIETAIFLLLRSVHSEKRHKGRVRLDAGQPFGLHIHKDRFKDAAQHITPVPLGRAGPLLPQALQGLACLLDFGCLGRTQSVKLGLQVRFPSSIVTFADIALFNEAKLQPPQLALEVSPLALDVAALFLVLYEFFQPLAPVLGQDQPLDQLGDLGIYVCCRRKLTADRAIHRSPLGGAKKVLRLVAFATPALAGL